MSVGLEKERLPRHVAVIMDGNGRWAQRRGLTRVEGHKRGKAAVQAIVEASGEIGLEYLTLYAFSTENWQRPVGEVRALMSLLRRYLRTELHRLMQNNVRLRAVGDLNRLPSSVQTALAEAVHVTQANSGLTVVLAVSYGGREEIVAAARDLASAVQAGRLTPQDIDERTFSQHLWTSDIPDPDLLIRTSGEFRLSNFLLWQVAYAEIYVTETLWPDFGRDEFLCALSDYQGRERRFGRTTEQQPATELRRVAR
ncbi:MAG: isoprenyl transferase [Deltaproteobacteria bacterium]|nr:isoprenyl transferase [Deltaproteobacteria bacterium]